MAKLIIRMTHNVSKDKIEKITVTVEGIAGEDCLGATAALRKMNPDAILRPTAEMDEDRLDEATETVLS